MDKKEYKEILKYEKQRYGVTNAMVLASFLGYSEKGIIWRYQKKLRKTEYFLSNGHKTLGRLSLLKLNKFGRKYGFSIPPNCFKKGLQIMHLGSILVNEKVRVGENCMVHINVALVATGGKTDSPQLGDNVTIGCGATIIGGIELGNNIAVGAGAVVTKSFKEDGIVLGGVPAKVISKKGHSAI